MLYQLSYLPPPATPGSAEEGKGSRALWIVKTLRPIRQRPLAAADPTPPVPAAPPVLPANRVYSCVIPPSPAPPAALPGDAAPRSQPLLSVEGLTVEFPVRGGPLGRIVRRIPAVDAVAFELPRGQTLGLVGESGSGKTTVGRAVLRLIPANAGRVVFAGRDVLAMNPAELRAWRRSAQIIFQDPGGSLNPRWRVIDILAEPLRVHRRFADQKELLAKVRELMDRCGLAWSAAGRYPHEFSGGQKQRIAIARALSLEPSLIVCDEPTSALDVSIQAQIINLLMDLQAERGLSYLFISHDMGVVSHICTRIAVMRQGRIVETGTRQQVLSSPREPYTQALLSAVPGRDIRWSESPERASNSVENPVS